MLEICHDLDEADLHFLTTCMAKQDAISKGDEKPMHDPSMMEEAVSKTTKETAKRHLQVNQNKIANVTRENTEHSA